MYFVSISFRKLWFISKHFLNFQDGSRRRTKGGVFIQLIKTDRHIEKKDVKEIFAEEEKEQKKILKYALTLFSKNKQFFN